MQDHPMLGVVLFLVGVILVAAAYAAPNGGSAPLFVGHILAFNGALLSLLGCHKREMQMARASRQTRGRNLPRSRR